MNFWPPQWMTAWMTVDQAVEYAREMGERISARGIRWAAYRGDIPGARKAGRDWFIPYDGLNHFFAHRPRPGRRPGWAR